MPDVRVFVDTNVFIYMHDKDSNGKDLIASTWLAFLADRELAVTNLQCLNELTNVLLKQRWSPLSQTAFDIVDKLAEFGSSPVGRNEVSTARELHALSRYSWWDCLLLASAIELGCSHFLSEDLQDGHVIGGLTVINPFLHAPDTLFGPVQD